MKFTRTALVLSVAGAVALACSDDNGTTGPSIADLVGTWTATAATLTPQGGAALDLVSLGTAITLTVASNSSYQFAINNAVLQLSDTITGEFTITGSSTGELTNDDDPGDTLQVTFSLSNNNNTLTVSVPDAELVDLSQPPDGVADPADLAMTLARQ
jgi:hypothetical protein